MVLRCAQGDSVYSPQPLNRRPTQPHPLAAINAAPTGQSTCDMSLWLRLMCIGADEWAMGTIHRPLQIG
jgi:hypothetical protein